MLTLSLARTAKLGRGSHPVATNHRLEAHSRDRWRERTPGRERKREHADANQSKNKCRGTAKKKRKTSTTAPEQCAEPESRGEGRGCTKRRSRISSAAWKSRTLRHCSLSSRSSSTARTST
eukprot:767036-Rhodomonas_salina.2